jgi:hypothetical protein
VFISGILSPLAALFLYSLVYETLTSLSADLEKDLLFRLCAAAGAMVAHFWSLLFLARPSA